MQLARSFLESYVGSGQAGRAQLEMALAHRIRDALDSLSALPGLPPPPHGRAEGLFESSLDALDTITGSWSAHETPRTYREPRRIWAGIPPPPSYNSPMGASTMGANSDFGLRV
jgi:hypothetical protein